MLKFNPKFRRCATQLLMLKIFDFCRDLYPNHEDPPPTKIKLDFDQKDAYNYEEHKSNTHTLEQFKSTLIAEIKIVRQMSQKSNK